MNQRKPKRVKQLRPMEPGEELNLASQLADLKLRFYQQSVLLSALIDLLIEKELIDHDEIARMAVKIDKDLSKDLQKGRKKESCRENE